MSSLIPLRVLILEDRAQDAELVLDELRQADFAPDWQRVETEQDYLAHLSADLDLIVADYNLPHFDGIRALYLLQERGLDIPFILVTGTIGDERAVAIMKTGAADYVLKDRLARLGEAVKHAMREKQLRDEKQQAERALRASEVRYRRLFETAKDGILILDADTGLIQDINPYLLSLLGYTNEDLLGKQLWEIGLFNDIVASKDAFAELVQKGYIRYEDLPLVTRDGQTVAVQFVSNVYQADGQKVIQCNIRDITDRLKAESTSRLLAAIVESSTDAIIGKTIDGTIISWNKGAEHIYGYSVEEAVGRSIEMLMLPEQHDDFALIMARIRRGERVEDVGAIRRRKDGTQVNISLTVSPLTDAHGNIVGASTIARDISERKRAEELLQEQRDLANQYVDVAGVTMLVLDTTGCIILLNKKGHEILGYEDDSLIGRNWIDVCLPSEERDELRKAFNRLMAGDMEAVEYYENTVLTKSGERRILSFHNAVIRDRSNQIIGTLSSGEDITDRKKIEAERLSAELLRTELNKEKEIVMLKEKFIMMVSHDFRTPLAVILMKADLLGRYLERLSAEQRLKYLADIRGQIKYMVQMLDDVIIMAQAHSGKLKANLVLVDIVPLCRDVCDQLQLADPLAHPFIVTFTGTFEDIYTDQHLLHRILFNLLSNATKYSPKGGDIRFEVSAEGQEVNFRISDPGIGIPEQDQKQLFELFHRAQNTGNIEGTGLGLAIVKASVDALGGQIAVESTEGVGTTFSVRVPKSLRLALT